MKLRWLLFTLAALALVIAFPVLATFLFAVVATYTDLNAPPAWLIIAVGLLAIVLHLRIEKDSKYHRWRNFYIHGGTRDFPVTSTKASRVDFWVNLIGQVALGIGGLSYPWMWTVLGAWVMLDVSIHSNNEFRVKVNSPAFKSAAFTLLPFGLWLLLTTAKGADSLIFSGAFLVGLLPLGGNVLWERQQAKRGQS